METHKLKRNPLKSEVGFGRSVPLVLFLGVVLVHSPILLVCGIDLAGRANCEYFAATWLTLAMLVLYLSGSLTALRWGSVALLLTDVALVTVASVIGSPWLGYVGLCLGSVAILGATKNRKSGRSLLPLGFLLPLTVRPPLILDVQEAASLQGWIVKSASLLLDQLGILHYTSGLVLHLPDNSFDVSKICSGSTSMFALLNLAILIAALHRRHWLVSVLLVGAGFLLAAVLNAVHVTIAVLVQVNFSHDLSAGWGGFAVNSWLIVTFLMCMLATDRFLLLCTDPIPTTEWDLWESDQDSDSRNLVVTYFNRFFALPRTILSPQTAKSSPPLWSRRWWAIMAFAASCLLALQTLGLVDFARSQGS